jgi:hypothetical protein
MREKDFSNAVGEGHSLKHNHLLITLTSLTPSGGAYVVACPGPKPPEGRGVTACARSSMRSSTYSKPAVTGGGSPTTCLRSRRSSITSAVSV